VRSAPCSFYGARESIPGRCLDVHPSLFPDVAAAFEGQLRSSQESRSPRIALQSSLPSNPCRADDPDALKVRAGQLVADLVQPAKAETLDKSGEGKQALEIAAGWVWGDRHSLHTSA
jgi:hypothetical protein